MVTNLSLSHTPIKKLMRTISDVLFNDDHLIFLLEKYEHDYNDNERDNLLYLKSIYYFLVSKEKLTYKELKYFFSEFDYANETIILKVFNTYKTSTNYKKMMFDIISLLTGFDNAFIVSFILVNRFLLMNNKMPFLIVPKYIEGLMFLVENRCYKLFGSFIDNANKLNQHLYVPKKILNIKYIKEIILKISSLELEKFNIMHIFLYGSYAMNKTNCFSDLDFHVILKNKYIDLTTSAIMIKKMLVEKLNFEFIDVTTTISNKNIPSKLLRSFKYEIQLL